MQEVGLGTRSAVDLQGNTPRVCTCAERKKKVVTRKYGCNTGECSLALSAEHKQVCCVRAHVLACAEDRRRDQADSLPLSLPLPGDCSRRRTDGSCSRTCTSLRRRPSWTSWALASAMWTPRWGRCLLPSVHPASPIRPNSKRGGSKWPRMPW